MYKTYYRVSILALVINKKIGKIAIDFWTLII